MKNNNINKLLILAAGCLVLGNTACNKHLDREPLSDIATEKYLWAEAHLADYTIGAYDFTSHQPGTYNAGTFVSDNGTDNQASNKYSNVWTPGELKTQQSGGDWGFSKIRNMNYYLQTVVPRWKSGKIIGSAANVNHYVGEGYFLRAYTYFTKLKALGDFPILRKTYKDEMEELVAISKRSPRNEVARFILSDLDSAIALLQNTPPSGKNRISKNAALLFKSRVALYEGSWLTYHKGTAHVPGGPGWPGAVLNPDFKINIDQEAEFFLSQAMDASAQVADAVPLTMSTKDNGYNSSENPYFKMFGEADLSKNDEVILWRQFSKNKNVTHSVPVFISKGGANSGYTRGFVDNFLMQNGLPIYAPGSGYKGDDSLQLVKADRDNRLQLFMKAPGELRLTDKGANGSPVVFPKPFLLAASAEERAVTGYSVKKGLVYLSSQVENNLSSVSGSIVFRAAEAYLNYIEASYMKNKVLDAKALEYWNKLRNRAKISGSIDETVAATDMTKEALNDFGAYSHGQLLADKVLYNIRRERRCEFMAEGMRWDDLMRWRALDQLKTKPYIIEGFKLWGPMQKWYVDDKTGKSLLITPEQGGVANVSSPKESPYIRPYRTVLTSSNLVKDGYRWTSAHYLNPIAIEHFTITAKDPKDNKTSVIYQNPGWALAPNQAPTDI